MIDRQEKEGYYGLMNNRGSEPRHPIRVVARRTGLSPALLRAWEKRYGVVVPSRSGGGQRLYSDDDVVKLSLLQRAVDEGRNISQVAGLSVEELQGLVEEDRAERRVATSSKPLRDTSIHGILEDARGAVEQMDPARLSRVLTRGALALPIPTLIDEVMVPLLGGIGLAWQEGRLGPAHEHLASVSIRRFLEWLLNTVEVGEGASVLVAATPARERHELGALLSAVSAAAEGWRAVYLGPDLPALEIAAAVLRFEARVVALSVVDPSLAEVFPDEIQALRKALPPSVRLVVGGPPALLAHITSNGGGEINFLTDLKSFRDGLRTRELRF